MAPSVAGNHPPRGAKNADGQRFAKKSGLFSPGQLASNSFVANERYVRNVGIRGLYQRGKVYYRVKNGRWESLGTTVRRVAVRLNRQLDERDNALKFLQKNGLGDLQESLRRVEEKVDQISVSPEQKVLAATFANPPRSDFAQEAALFYDNLACTSDKTKTGWGTYRKATGNIPGAIELLLTYSETGAEFTNDFGDHVNYTVDDLCKHFSGT